MGFGLGDLNPVRIVEGKGAIGESGLGGLVIGAGLAAMGIPPQMAALYTGGASALLTGDLKQGLFMGMGAYGGAGLMGGLEGLGEKELAEKELGKTALSGTDLASDQALAANQAANAEAIAADPLQSMNQTQVTSQATPINAAQTGQTVQTTTAAPGLEGVNQRLTNAGAGIDRLTSSGGIDALSKQMAANAANPAIGGPASLMGAAGWSGAGALGTYKQPNPAVGAAQKPGYIRQFTYDPYGQRYNALTPVQADQWGSRSFQDAFKAADGGIVALAHGGAVPGYADGGVSDAEIKAYVTAHQDDPAAIAAAAQQYGVSTADLSRATGYTPEQFGSYFSNAGVNFGAAPAAVAPAAVAAPAPVDVNANINNWLQSNPNATYQQMREAAAGSGITDQQIIDAYNKFGYSAADQNVTMNKNWANAQGQTGYQGLNANINNWLEQYPTATKADALQAMLDSGLNEKDVIRATGKTLAQLFDEKKKEAVKPVIALPGISNAPSVANVSTSLPGDITKNADGTVTVHPNLPGGGNFTGVGDVKDTYTAGGGSLGYVSPVVKSAAEHEAMYNTLTGGSKAAFDYLMGKTEYSPVPYTPTGEIMKPYAESVLGVPADNTRFAQRFNPVTRKYEANPDYKPFIFNQDTGQTTRGMNTAELRAFVADPNNLKTPSAESAGFLGTLVKQLNEGLLDRPVWMAQNNVSYEQLAAALGISVAEAKKRYPAKASASTTTASTTEAPGNKAGGLMGLAGGGLGTLGGYSDGGRLLRGPGDGVSDSIPASIGDKQPARLADGEFVVPARIVSELGNGSTDAGARKLYAMMDRVQKARGKTTGKGKVATNSRADKYLPV